MIKVNSEIISKEILYNLSSVVHALQRERGCVSIFLYSNGEFFFQKTHNQFIQSDHTIRRFQQKLDHWETLQVLTSSRVQKLKSILTNHSKLDHWRKKIITKKVMVSHIINQYSHQLIGTILQNMVEIALTMQDSNLTHVSAYNAFLNWKERIGLERTIGAQGVVKCDFANQEFAERMLVLLSEQNNYHNTYLALATYSQIKFMKKMLSNCAACTRLDALHDTLKEPTIDQNILNDLTPEAWYDLISAKIDALHIVEKHLIETLCQKSSLSKAPAAHQVRRCNNFHGPFGIYDTLVRSLQLFSGLSSEWLYDMVRPEYIKNFSKGKLLFLEGEHADKLYIILKGWVKIFKGTVNGEEIVLQMLSSGNVIMESAVFLNTIFPVSAQIAEDTTLLALPAPLIRKQAKNNNILALNLLSSMSYSSQCLIRQIENARLKTADERVGWFLLKLHIEQGFISQSVKLPYDKSFIASYLDMKRETFSRALKKLKDKGLKVQNDTIFIPDMMALCCFCDVNAAHHCALNKTPECPNPQGEISKTHAQSY